MKKGLLDTNFYVAFKRNDTQALEIVRSLDLERFLNSARTHIINHDINTAVFYAHIIKLLKEKGTPIPTNDVWIAATAMQHGLTLHTLDKHFDAIDGLLR